VRVLSHDPIGGAGNFGALFQARKTELGWADDREDYVEYNEARESGAPIARMRSTFRMEIEEIQRAREARAAAAAVRPAQGQAAAAA
jgi:hypothetical protein